MPEKKKCVNCFFWSYMIAYEIGTGPVHAMCLNDNSDKFKSYTTEDESCPDYETSNGKIIDKED